MRAATLAHSVSFDGVGLHTGNAASITISPAPPNTGFVFEVDGVRIPALAEYASESPLATVLSHDGKTISTVEHVLSALMGSGVSEAVVALRGDEMPIADGSATQFCAAIARAGIVELDATRPELILDEPFEMRDGERVLVLLPSDAFRVRFASDFPPPIGAQYADVAITPHNYLHEIAGARTFGLLRDVEELRARGLARGGSLDNALVFDDDGPMQPLTWRNEVVRHKILDLIGDFALLGAWPRCDVIAIKSGHAMHTRLARELRARA